MLALRYCFNKLQHSIGFLDGPRVYSPGETGLPAVRGEEEKAHRHAGYASGYVVD